MKIKTKGSIPMKKVTAILMTLVLILASASVLAEPVGNENYTVKTGVSYSNPWGITVANVIYKDGELFKILVDTVRPDGGLSSKEKYDDYGIRAVSGLGKEWWEEVAFFETWAESNDVSALELDENGHALDADVISGATINLANYVEAVQNAEAGVVEAEGFSVKTGFSFSEQWGATIANVIYKDDAIFKILLDTVRPDGGLSSKEKFDDYGIKRVSGLGKEWWEEVSFFETWAEGNDLSTLELDENGHAVNADVISGATINLGNHTEAILDALSK